MPLVPKLTNSPPTTGGPGTVRTQRCYSCGLSTLPERRPALSTPGPPACPLLMATRAVGQVARSLPGHGDDHRYRSGRLWTWQDVTPGQPGPCDNNKTKGPLRARFERIQWKPACLRSVCFFGRAGSPFIRKAYNS
jgi:hypothetical protein